MSQEIKLDQETKEKIRDHLEEFEQKYGRAIDELLTIKDKFQEMQKSVEIKSFVDVTDDNIGDKKEMLSHFTDLKSAMDTGMENIINVDDDLGTAIENGIVTEGGGENV